MGTVRRHPRRRRHCRDVQGSYPGRSGDGRAALIETDTAHAREWAELFRGKPALIIQPRDGGAHPVAPARGAIQ